MSCETPMEYRRTHNELTRFLNLGTTVTVLGMECIKSITELQMNLKSKESKLAAYQRFDLKCSMEACTTSPAESMNHSIKHTASKVNSRVNLDNSLCKIVNGVTNRLQRRQKLAHREMNQNNLSSKSPTREYLIQKGQGLADQFYDDSLKLKSARLGFNSLISWNFDLIDTEILDQVDNLGDFKLAIPAYCRVRNTHVVQHSDGRNFVQCTCNRRVPNGMPCDCFYRQARNAEIPTEKIMDICMFDVRWLKIYNAHYGCDDDEMDGLGAMLYQAQKECFLTEGMGIQISDEYRDMLLEGKDYGGAQKIALPSNDHTTGHKFDDDSSENNSQCFDNENIYPILGPNTTREDFDEAMWVLGREDSGKTTTWIDLQLHLEGINPLDIGMDDWEDIDDLPLHQFFSGMNQLVSISSYASKLHAGISATEGGPNEVQDVTTTHRSYEYRQSFRKWFDDEMKSVIDNSMVTDSRLEELKSGMEGLFSDFQDDTNDLFGVEGGGENTVELFCHPGGGNSPIKKTHYGMSKKKQKT